jgi:WD40 repeat protein
MPSESMSCATCALYDADDRRLGSGVLVDKGTVLTAAHVLRDVAEVLVRFRDHLGDTAVPVTRIRLPAQAQRRDVAALRLRATKRWAGLVPEPAPLWPYRRLPERCVLFGFPAAEGRRPHGIWTEAAHPRRIAGGWVQLQWENQGSLAGHSGGPVGDAETGRVFAILVEGSDSLRFDRAVPIELIHVLWPQFALPWARAGAGAVGFFNQRRLGQANSTSREDVFKGREAACARVTMWLASTVAPNRPLVITGQPGAGKSAVLARASHNAELAGLSSGLYYYAGQGRIEQFVDAVCALLDLPVASNWQDGLFTIGEQEIGRRSLLVIDALDEISDRRELGDFRRAIREIAARSDMRVVVATRAVTPENPYGKSSHLHSLGVLNGPQSENLVDLDADIYYEEECLQDYAAGILTQNSNSSATPGGAWQSYRATPDATRRLSRLIARRARRSYLVAGMTALALAEDDVVLDPFAPDFDVYSLPSEVGDALERSLRLLSDDGRLRAKDLLIALAYARGSGLEDTRWLGIAAALGFDDLSLNDIRKLRDSALSDFLVVSVRESGRPVSRLFHQALVDELLQSRSRPADEAAIVRSLMAGVGDAWADIDDYTRSFLPAHAAAAGKLLELFDDAGFLASVSPVTMRALMPREDMVIVGSWAEIYDTSLPMLTEDAGINASVLDLVAGMYGRNDLRRRLANSGISRRFGLTGWLRKVDRPAAWFDGHAGPLHSACVVQAGTKSLLITGSADATAKVWYLDRPFTELGEFTRHQGEVRDVKAYRTARHPQELVLSVSVDGTAKLWDPTDPDEELAVFRGHDGPIWRAECLPWPGLSDPVVVTTSADETARIWDPWTGSELRRFTAHSDVVVGVLVLQSGRRDTIVVTSSDDGTVRSWTPGDMKQIAILDLPGLPKAWGLSQIPWPGRSHPVVVVGFADAVARIWDPISGEVLADYRGHSAGVWYPTTLPWPGLDHHVVATASGDGTVRIWDPRNTQASLATIEQNGVGTVHWVSGSARKGLVTTADDRRGRFWDLGRLQAAATQHGGSLTSWAWAWEVTPITLPGRNEPHVATTFTDGVVRVMDTLDPTRAVAEYHGHDRTVVGATTLYWPELGRQVMVTTSDDGSLQVWDPADPDECLMRYDNPGTSLWGVATMRWEPSGRDVVVVTSSDHIVRVWDPLSGDVLCGMTGHEAGVWKCCVTRWPTASRETVVVTTSADQSVRVWDPYAQRPQLAILNAHTDVTVDVASVPVPQSPYPWIVTTSDDRNALVWDPRQAGRPVGRMTGHQGVVTGVCALERFPGDARVATASTDHTVRIWDVRSPSTEIARYPLFGSGNRVRVVSGSRLAVATARGLQIIDDPRA